MNYFVGQTRINMRDLIYFIIKNEWNYAYYKNQSKMAILEFQTT